MRFLELQLQIHLLIIIYPIENESATECEKIFTFLPCTSNFSIADSPAHLAADWLFAEFNIRQLAMGSGQCLLDGNADRIVCYICGEVCLTSCYRMIVGMSVSMYIIYISVSKSTPLAVSGPHGQLTSELFSISTLGTNPKPMSTQGLSDYTEVI